jgi:hypothetical protein
VRPKRSRKEHRPDRKVLPRRPCCNLGNLHGASIRVTFAATPPRLLQ